MIKEKEEYILNLEQRVEKLEKLLEHLCIEQCKEISFNDCPIGDLTLGDNCKVTLQTCSVGAMFSDVEDAENRVNDLESRIDDIMTDLDVAESRLDGFTSSSEEE